LHHPRVGSGGGTMRSVQFLAHVLVVALTLSLAGCGGGGGGGSTAGGAAGGSSSGGSSSGGSGGGGTSGGGSGGGGSAGGTAVAPAQLGPNLGQALLGPIVGATVEVYEAENFDGVVVCTVTTSAANAPEGPGVVNLSTCPISGSSVYFLVVHGGMDIDANDDEVVDASPTAKAGSLRAIISGRSILDGDFRINIVTEIAYQGVADALLNGANGLEILDRLDALARQLLSGDLNGDGIVDNEDLLAFSPVDDANFLAGSYEELLGEILAAILSGNRNELTRLSRQLLLSSLGEHDFRELVDPNGDYQLLIHDFLVEDDFIYAAGYDIGSSANDLRVFVLDATDFSAVSLVGQYSNENLPVSPQGAALDLLKIGDLLYLSSQGNGLFLVDVSDPTALSATLHFEGGYIYSMSLGPEGLMYWSWDEAPGGITRRIDVVDIADPANPVIVGEFGHGLPVFEMLYVEGMLYVYGPGIAVFDASSPMSPAPLGTVLFAASSSTTVVYRDGLIYAPITDASAGLQGMTIVDVRDPLHPRRIDDIAGIGFITEIDVHEDKLYATASTSFGASYTLTAFEIGVDGALELIESRSTPMAYHLRYENGRVYLANALQLTAYDANALNKRVEHFAFLATDKAANHVEVVGGVAYVANDTELLAVDVSDPAAGLSILDRVSVIHIINGIEIVGGHAYLANGTEGIKIVDVSDPHNLQVLGSNDELNPFTTVYGQTAYNETFAIAVKDNLAYTVVGGYPYVKLGVFAIDDPTAPAVVHSVDFPYPLGALAINNDTLYGVDTFGGASLYILDIEGEPELLDPTRDVLARAFELDGAYLYTTSGTAGLSVFNVASESNPILFGSALSLGIGHAVSVLGNVAYVANDFGMVEIYDVLDKTAPALAGQLPIGGVVKDVFATDEYIYAVNGLGLVIEPAVRLHDALD
jgi:hypothetical protein